MPKSNHRSNRRRRSLRSMKGGSPASDRVMSFLTAPSPLHNNVVSPRIPGDPTKLNLYQTTGGARKSRRSRRRRRSRKNTRRLRRSQRQRGGGSDWAHTLYSRGPVSTPDYPGRFGVFSESAPFVSNQDLYLQGVEGSRLAGAPVSGGARKLRRRRRRKRRRRSRKLSRKSRK